MSDIEESGISYDYDEAAATKSDKAADALTDGGAYIGKFVSVEATTSEKKGTKGVKFAFTSPGSGNAEFTLWTQGEDGTKYFGFDQLQGLMFLMGVKSLKSVKGKVTAWVDNEKGQREQQEIDGFTFPDLCNKPIGVVFQQELYSTNKGATGSRLSLHGAFQPETKLMMSEIKERKTTPAKLDRLLKGLKVKDTRKASAAEPSQPSMGVGEGEY